MPDDKEHEFELGKLVEDIRQFVRRAAGSPPWLERHHTGEWPAANELPQLAKLTEAVSRERDKAEEQVEAGYQERRDAKTQLIKQRRKRLEAYTKRDRKAIAVANDRFIVAGRVIDESSRVGLPNVKVRVVGQEQEFSDRLGGTRTDALGYFRIDYTAELIEELAGRELKISVEVLADDGETLYTLPKPLAPKVGTSEYVAAPVTGEKVPASLKQGQKIELSVNKRIEEFRRRERILKR